MRWRAYTERPEAIPCVAVIAVQDVDGERHLLSHLYTLTKHRNLWWNELDGQPLTEVVFWWLPEVELLAAIDDDLKRAEIRRLANERRTGAATTKGVSA